MWAMNDFERPDADSPRPNLANSPSMDDMLALYEKVLSELDSAIYTQREFANEKSASDLPRDWTQDIIDK
jgi:hypothetical protein